MCLGNILIVDDSPNVRRLIKMYLEISAKKKCKSSLTVYQAATPEEAVEILTEYKIEVALVDFDFGTLSETNGVELIIKIKDEFPSIFTVLSSAHHSFSEDAWKYVTDGTIDLIASKPITAHKFDSILAHINK